MLVIFFQLECPKDFPSKSKIIHHSNFIKQIQLYTELHFKCTPFWKFLMDLAQNLLSEKKTIIYFLSFLISYFLKQWQYNFICSLDLLVCLARSAVGNDDVLYIVFCSGIMVNKPMYNRPMYQILSIHVGIHNVPNQTIYHIGKCPEKNILSFGKFCYLSKQYVVHLKTVTHPYRTHTHKNTKHTHTHIHIHTYIMHPHISSPLPPTHTILNHALISKHNPMKINIYKIKSPYLFCKSTS